MIGHFEVESSGRLCVRRKVVAGSLRYSSRRSCGDGSRCRLAVVGCSRQAAGSMPKTRYLAYFNHPNVSHLSCSKQIENNQLFAQRQGFQRTATDSKTGLS